MTSISLPYLLSVSVPLKKAADGSFWADTSWAKDLALHTVYIEKLTLICPCMPAEPSHLDVPLGSDPFSRIRIVELHHPVNTLDAIKHLPKTVASMWQEVGRHAIVHTGFGWWPIGEGLFAAPMSVLRKRFLITYIESSFWRVSGEAPKSYHRLKARVLEYLYKKCVRYADLSFFTSEQYRREFNSDRRTSHVIPASWIDESVILAQETAAASWQKKAEIPRFLFAGRLLKEKGAGLLLEASKRSKVQLDIIGEGPLLAEWQQMAARNPGHIAVLKQVPYGPTFFSLLRNYHAVIVPSLSDEQPRIVFDAFSQAVPAIGADTGGISEIVADGKTGILFHRGDADSLAQVMTAAASNRAGLQTMGIAALSRSWKSTHSGMHQTRSEIINQALKKLQFWRSPLC